MKKIIAIIAIILPFVISAWAAPAGAEDIRRVQFDHKRMNIHLNLTFKKFESMEKMLPRSLRDVIAKDYYPYLRQHLTQTSSLQYRDADVTVTRLGNGLITLKMEFPNYFLTFKNIKWEDLDNLYHVHFESAAASE